MLVSGFYDTEDGYSAGHKDGEKKNNEGSGTHRLAGNGTRVRRFVLHTDRTFAETGAILLHTWFVV